MNIELRNFEDTDIPFYEELQKEINASQYMSRYYPRNYKKENSEYYFNSIFLDNSFIGVIYFEPDFDQTKSYYLGIMIGKNSLLGRGIGKVAIQKGIEKLQEEITVGTIKLNVRADNKRAVNCYKNFGFNIIKTYNITKDNSKKECYSMEYKVKKI